MTEMKKSLEFGVSPRLSRLKDQEVAQPIILAVGEISLWRAAGRLLHPSSQLTYVEFSDLTTQLLQAVAPDIVLSNMISRSFDCLDLAQFLHQAGFQGRYRIIDANVPNPRLIMHEINVLCPGLDANVVPLGQDGPLRTH